MASIDEVAAIVRSVQAELPVAEALEEADRLDKMLRRVAALECESRNKLLTEARDRLMHARDTLRRTAGHWGTAGSHLDEYLIKVLGIAPTGSLTYGSASQLDPATVDRSTPPGWAREPSGISAQKQNRHVLGTREYAQRKTSGEGASAFFDGDAAERLTRAAWERGLPINAQRSYIREHDFGYPIGVDSRGNYQARVRAHLDFKGRLHGHPCGPSTTRPHEDDS